MKMTAVTAVDCTYYINRIVDRLHVSTNIDAAYAAVVRVLAWSVEITPSGRAAIRRIIGTRLTKNLAEYHCVMKGDF